MPHPVPPDHAVPTTTSPPDPGVAPSSLPAGPGIVRLGSLAPAPAPPPEARPAAPLPVPDAAPGPAEALLGTGSAVATPRKLPPQVRRDLADRRALSVDPSLVPIVCRMLEAGLTLEDTAAACALLPHTVRRLVLSDPVVATAREHGVKHVALQAHDIARRSLIVAAETQRGILDGNIAASGDVRRKTARDVMDAAGMGPEAGKARVTARLRGAEVPVLESVVTIDYTGRIQQIATRLTGGS